MRKESPQKISRRTLFAGASVAGAAAAVGSLLPRAQTETTAPMQKEPAPSKGGGYRLTEHVRQYYQTTRV